MIVSAVLKPSEAAKSIDKEVKPAMTAADIYSGQTHGTSEIYIKVAQGY